MILFGNAISWSIVATRSRPTKLCWYSGLMLVVVSVTIASWEITIYAASVPQPHKRLGRNANTPRF